ncbi:very short patch repair endonuclease [Photorhabdus sp. SF281]|uniref:very short patch repair endonuclease n=1 Tax=Photorhabdus sp. SF281 TaxID=3459527 RepID=UPI0040450FB1
MADVHNPSTRSKNMRAIRNCDTAIEKKLVKILHNLGVIYRMQVSDLPGKPDFVIDEYQAILFVHGCFWHGHNCHLFKTPATRTEFWLDKIGKNIKRDQCVMNFLSDNRWKILVVWECTLRGRLKLTDNELSERIEEWLCVSETHAEIDTVGIHKVFLQKNK